MGKSDRLAARSNGIGSSAAPRFAINGRFYGQPVTGVQRYAREIVREIDQELGNRGKRAELLIPPGADAAPTPAAIEVRGVNGASGHLWEQTLLPLRATAPLLNLCNMGPLALRRQIVCIHDTNVFDAPDSYSRAFRTAYHLLIPGLARRAMTITTVSNASARMLKHHLGFASLDVSVIPNGHEHVYRWEGTNSRLASSLAGLRPFVLLLGSRARHKNAAFILQQAEALDSLGLDLVVAGGSAEIFAQTGSIEAANIHRLGFVSDDDLAWLYSRALCLAFPSRQEGFGIPLVEAMALGCPVVSSDQSCMPEICGDAALLAGPDDAPAWQAHFRNLIASSVLREDFKGRGLERVKLFSWRASAQSYLNLLDRL